MDQTAMVGAGQELVKLMDAAHFEPRAAIWVHNTETDGWRLWIVPPSGVTDQRDLYLSTGQDHRAAPGRVSGVGATRMQSNMLNGFYLPDGIVLRITV